MTNVLNKRKLCEIIGETKIQIYSLSLILSDNEKVSRELLIEYKKNEVNSLHEDYKMSLEENFRLSKVIYHNKKILKHLSKLNV